MTQPEIKVLQLDQAELITFIDGRIAATNLTLLFDVSIGSPVTVTESLTYFGSPESTAVWTNRPGGGGVGNIVAGDGITVTTGSPQVTIDVDSTVARRNATNTFEQANTFTAAVSGIAIAPALFQSAAPGYILDDTSTGGSPTDESIWRMFASTGDLTFDTRNDANNTSVNWLTVSRTGVNPNVVSLNGTQVEFHVSAHAEPHAFFYDAGADVRRFVLHDADTNGTMNFGISFEEADATERGFIGFGFAALTQLQISNRFNDGELHINVRDGGSVLRPVLKAQPASNSTSLYDGSQSNPNISIVTFATGGLHIRNEETGPASLERAYTTADRGNLVEEWVFNGALTMTDPNASRFKLNNGTLSNVTQMAIDDTTISSFEFREFFGARLVVGDRILIKQKNDSTKWVIFEISEFGSPLTAGSPNVPGPIDNGTWWQIPVTYVDGGGLFTGNEHCGFEFIMGVAIHPTVARMSPSGSPTISNLGQFRLPGIDLWSTNDITFLTKHTRIPGVLNQSSPGFTQGGVDLSVDGSRAVIGYRGLNNSASGVVFVLDRSGNSYVEFLRIEQPAEAGDDDGDNFGKDVGMNADGTTIIAGVNVQNSGTGGAWIFELFESGSPAFTRFKIDAPNPDANDNFGENVAMSADGLTAVVGSRGDDVFGSPTLIINAGNAFVYHRGDSTWSLVAIIEPPFLGGSPTAGDFGNDVATDATGNRVVVGQPNVVSSTGSAHVFLRNTGSPITYTLERTIDVIGSPGLSQLGQQVSINSDGTVIAASARREFSDTGRIYIFERSGSPTTWSFESKVQPDVASSFFGTTISLNDDGEFLVGGADLEDGPNVDDGAVYIFKRNSGSWDQVTRIAQLGSPTNSGANFGSAVAISGDGSTLVAGAKDFDTRLVNNTGAAFLYVSEGDALTPTIGFGGDANTGLYETAPNVLALAIDGVEKVTISADLFAINQALRIYDATNTDFVNFVHDGVDLNITSTNTAQINIAEIGTTVHLPSTDLSTTAPALRIGVGSPSFTDQVAQLSIINSADSTIALRNTVSSAEIWISAENPGVELAASGSTFLDIILNGTVAMEINDTNIDFIGLPLARVAFGVREDQTLATTENDYNFGVNPIQMLVADAGNTTINGFLAASDGRMLYVHNLAGPGSPSTAGNIILAHETGATLTSRMLLPGGLNLTLEALESATLFYDATSARWRLLSTTGALA